jgi:hypothetical protein
MANEQTIAQSKKFINSIHAVLNILDTISSLIPEGAYLEIANQLKISNDEYTNKEAGVVIIGMITQTRENLINNDIVIQHRRRALKKTITHKLLTDAQKLEKGWVMCNKCNRLVVHIHRHLTTTVCSQTSTEKKLSASSGKIDTYKMKKAIHKIHEIIINYLGFNTKLLNIREKLTGQRVLDECVKDKSKYVFNRDSWEIDLRNIYFKEQFDELFCEDSFDNE